MMRPQPMIVLADAPKASEWFQDVLGFRSGHGEGEYEIHMEGDELVAQLHHWHAHEHSHLGDRHGAMACCSGSQPTTSTRSSRGFGLPMPRLSMAALQRERAPARDLAARTRGLPSGRRWAAWLAVTEGVVLRPLKYAEQRGNE